MGPIYLTLPLFRFVFLTAEEVVLLVRETDDGWCTWLDGCLFGPWQFKGLLGGLRFGGWCGSRFALGVEVWRVRWCLEVIMVVCNGCWWMVFAGEEMWFKWWRGEMREVEVSLRWWWWLDVIMIRWLCWWWKLSHGQKLVMETQWMARSCGYTGGDSGVWGRRLEVVWSL